MFNIRSDDCMCNACNIKMAKLFSGKPPCKRQKTDLCQLCDSVGQHNLTINDMSKFLDVMEEHIIESPNNLTKVLLCESHYKRWRDTRNFVSIACSMPHCSEKITRQRDLRQIPDFDIIINYFIANQEDDYLSLSKESYILTKDECANPLHILLGDTVDSYSGSSKLSTILNSFGILSSKIKCRQHVSAIVEEKISTKFLEDLDRAAFTVVSIDNIDVGQPHASAKINDPQRGIHATSYQALQPNPNTLNISSSEALTTGSSIVLSPEGTIQIGHGCTIKIEGRIKQKHKCNFKLYWQKIEGSNEARNITFCDTIKYSGTNSKTLAPVFVINKAEKEDAGIYQLKYESNKEVVISGQISVQVFRGKL
ncbi:Hypothetical predicted protein [Mytilus galloprovincialis]|uniref:Uncharacterized protein n=1 Tax=Mytilus galloprovincialis TaxID=29158 RepID=A0A8B6DH93_MYTGA|nr:Hypothetical predicted protein [Mytilus galloprovincialis]